VGVFGLATGWLINGPLAEAVNRDVDGPVRRAVEAHYVASWAQALQRTSDFGMAPVAGAVALTVGGAAAMRRRSGSPVVVCLSAFLGAGLVTAAIKLAVRRRPAQGPIRGLLGTSFPSGHTLFAVAVYGSVALVVVRSDASAVVRWTTAAALCALVLAVAAARVYLLVHFFTDVLGSLGLGIGVLAGVREMERGWPQPPAVVRRGRAASTRAHPHEG
jgi:membrane-associated phospholipid phosphatase